MTVRSKALLTAVLLSILTPIFAGCATTVHLTTPFDAAKAQEALQAGTNKIAGSALIRQQGGGIVTCAGNEVSLIPVTPYATERMQHLYGSDQRGFSTRAIKFEPDNPEYFAAQKNVACDSLGLFEFDGVADGEYYVVTAIVWVIGYSPQGGRLMQRVSLSSGETKKVVLSS